MAYQKVYMNQIHSSSLLSQLSEMWKRDILCDAVINTGTVNTKAHRLVLVAACPMLQSMDSASVGNKLEVKLSPDIQTQSVTSFLHYLYDGFMTLTEDNVRDIEKIARLLQVDSVTKCCNDFYKVLEETVGQVMGSSQKFCVNTYSGELRHIKTSDLQKLVHKSSEKRSADGEEISSRKRAKLNKQMAANLTQTSGEDSFQLIQSDYGDTGNQCKNKFSAQQSLAVSIASRTDPADENLHVGVVEKHDTAATTTTSATRQLSSPHQYGYLSPQSVSGSSTSPSLDLLSSATSSNNFTKPKSFHRPFSPISRLTSASRPKAGYPSGSKSDTNYHLHKLVDPHTKETSANSQNVWPLVHPEGQKSSQNSTHLTQHSDQITIEPMSEEYQSSNVGLGLSPKTVMDSPSNHQNLDKSEQLNGDSGGRKDENEAHTSSQNQELPRVKVEIDTDIDPYSLASGSQDDNYSYNIEENEEETSDTDHSHYGDMGQTSLPSEEQAAFWYTQSFKEVVDGEKRLSGILQEHKRQPTGHKPLLYDRFGDKNWIHGKISCLPLHQKLVRALASLKSPVVFLRSLQRKVSGGVKIDVLKAECAKLANQGFGQFHLKNDSNILQRDTYFKPSPDQLDQNDPFLASVHITHEYYRMNYNDISPLTSEELHLICAVHPDKDYVVRLCENVIDTQSFVIKKMEKMANSVVPYGPLPPPGYQGSGNTGASGEHSKQDLLNPLMCLEMTASRFLYGKQNGMKADKDGGVD